MPFAFNLFFFFFLLYLFQPFIFVWFRVNVCSPLQFEVDRFSLFFCQCFCHERLYRGSRLFVLGTWNGPYSTILHRLRSLLPFMFTSTEIFTNCTVRPRNAHPGVAQGYEWWPPHGVFFPFIFFSVCLCGQRQGVASIRSG